MYPKKTIDLLEYVVFTFPTLTQICGENDPGFTRTLVGSMVMTLPPQAI